MSKYGKDKMWIEEVPCDDREMMGHMVWTGFEWIVLPFNWLPMGASTSFVTDRSAMRGGIPYTV